jgi:uncharacterized repeat protein (TIGR02543 family)
MKIGILAQNGFASAAWKRAFLTVVTGLVLALSGVSVRAQSVTFAWNASSDPNVAGYLLYSSTDGVNFTATLDAGLNTSVTVDGLTPGATMYFEIVSYDTNYDESLPSSALSYVVPMTQSVAVQANPANGGSVGGGGVFNIGSSVTVTASPATGYTFVGWTENGAVQSTSTSYNFSMVSNCTLVANFVAGNPVLYDVSTQISPAKSGNIVGGGEYASGSSVTVTAVANSGYAFVNWMVDGVVQSTSAGFTFTVTTNVNLAANFTNSIIAQVPTNYTVTSSAGPNGGVSPLGAQPVPSGSNIKFTAVPSSGYQVNQWLVNGLAAQAGGLTYTLVNVTASASVSVTFNTAPSSPTNAVAPSQSPGGSFSLSINGSGALTPKSTAGNLQQGKKYTLTAVPSKGYVFAGWVSNGTVVMPTVKYTFTVESNVTLQADFIPNPFTPVVGTYHGLFYVTNDAAEDSSGSIVATVSGTGAYTAKLKLGSGGYSMAGSLSVAGALSKTINRPGSTPLAVDLQLDLTNAVFTGTISDGTWTADVVADPAVYSRTNPAPEAGKYTMVIPGSDEASSQPGGNGFGSVIVTSLGTVTFTGTLGDGTTVTASSVVTSDGQWPFFAPLYGGKGSILGWLNFTNTGLIAGDTAWFKLPMSSAKLYPGGFTNNATVMGSSYQFTNGEPLLGSSEGDLILTNGDLSAGVTNSIVIGSQVNLTTGGSSGGTANNAKVTFVDSTGMFRGTVLNPDTGKEMPYSGVVLQNQGLGAGLFVGPNETGSAVISPTK